MPKVTWLTDHRPRPPELWSSRTFSLADLHLACYWKVTSTWIIFGKHLLKFFAHFPIRFSVCVLVCVCMHFQRPLNVLFYHSFPTSLRRVSHWNCSLNLLARLAVTYPQWFSCLYASQNWVMSGFFIGAGDHTQILTQWAISTTTEVLYFW